MIQTTSILNLSKARIASEKIAADIQFGSADCMTTIAAAAIIPITPQRIPLNAAFIIFDFLSFSRK